MGFADTPFGFDPPPGGLREPAVSTPSSRLIDFRTGRYVLDSDGNFAGMPDLHQRVALLISYGTREPELIEPCFACAVEVEIRRALRPLTEGHPPAAIIRRIEVSTTPGNSFRLVVFRDGSSVKVVK